MKKENIKKVVLAYSGGLDTSIIIPWLKENYNNCEVVAVSGDVGQGTELDGLEEKAVKTGKAALVIVAGDASENTKKMFTNMCAFYEVPVYIYSDKETLGHAIGKQFRASLAVVDEGFRNTIEKHLKNGLEQQM